MTFHDCSYSCLPKPPSLSLTAPQCNHLFSREEIDLAWEAWRRKSFLREAKEECQVESERISNQREIGERGETRLYVGLSVCPSAPAALSPSSVRPSW